MIKCIQFPFYDISIPIFREFLSWKLSVVKFIYACCGIGHSTGKVFLRIRKNTLIWRSIWSVDDDVIMNLLRLLHIHAHIRCDPHCILFKPYNIHGKGCEWLVHRDLFPSVSVITHFFGRFTCAPDSFELVYWGTWHVLSGETLSQVKNSTGRWWDSNPGPCR